MILCIILLVFIALYPKGKGRGHVRRRFAVGGADTCRDQQRMFSPLA